MSKTADRYCVIGLEKKTTKGGKPYLDLKLAGESGELTGRVWSDAMPNVEVELNKVSFLEGKIEEYQGKQQLIIESGYILRDEKPDEFLEGLNTTPTLVFDIETIGMPFDEIEEHSQEYILDRLERVDRSDAAAVEQAKGKTGLYPLFAYVGAIGLLDTRGKGCVLLLHDQPVEMEDPTFTCETFADEASLIRRFWEIAEKYQRLVTFNGTGFDWPFLVFRSGVNRVKVPFSLKNWGDEKHIDLKNEVPPGRNNYSLAEISKAMGTFNPKEAGVSGGDVGRLFEEGKQADVAQYVARDVTSTLELYDVWRQFMAGRVIL